MVDRDSASQNDGTNDEGIVDSTPSASSRRKLVMAHSQQKERNRKRECCCCFGQSKKFKEFWRMNVTRKRRLLRIPRLPSIRLAGPEQGAPVPSTYFSVFIRTKHVFRPCCLLCLQWH
jgi:hypothetical protein